MRVQGYVRRTPEESLAANRERSHAFWQKKRARGQCTATGCEKASTEINPSTGRPFWMCRDCRRAGKHS